MLLSLFSKLSDKMVIIWVYVEKTHPTDRKETVIFPIYPVQG